MTEYRMDYLSDSKNLYLEELKTLEKELTCGICGNKVHVGWDYSSEEDGYYYHILCSECTFIDDCGYYECFGTDWCGSLNEALVGWHKINERPCDFLKNNHGVDCCPNYGSSDCPITMKEDKECSITKEYLLEIMKYWK